MTSLARRTARVGAIAPLTAVFLIVMIGMTAFAIDLSHTFLAKAELQRSADAAAMAACWEFASKRISGSSEADAAIQARAVAAQYVSANQQGTTTLLVDQNSTNGSSGDIVLGKFSGFGSVAASIAPQIESNTNAVRVTVHRDATRNGPLALIFGAAIGTSTASLSTTATAAWVRDIRGFKSPGDDTISILPFSVKDTKWQELMSGTGTDNWHYDAVSESITPGGDGIKELNIYPTSTASGNFGTVDVGNSNNSAADITRQILYGANENDLSYLGGKLELGSNGKLILNGDTGISASIKSPLERIRGEPRTIFLHESVSGNGNNANYTVTKFVGVRVMEVELTGNQKCIMIQPALVTAKHVIPSTEATSDYIYSPVVLVQ